MSDSQTPGESLVLRAATMRDSDMLLHWRNDPETRRESHTPDAVHPDQHMRWLSETLEDPNRRLYVAEVNGRPVGTVRADLSVGTWELSWTVAPESRGRGIGKRMVRVLARSIAEPIRATVKEGNMASARIAEHAGMTCDGRVGAVLHYSRPALGHRGGAAMEQRGLD